MVIFQAPKDPGRVYTKRVVAIGGDTLEIRCKQVFINGIPAEHPFAYFGLNESAIRAKVMCIYWSADSETGKWGLNRIGKIIR